MSSRFVSAVACALVVCGSLACSAGGSDEPGSSSNGGSGPSGNPGNGGGFNPNPGGGGTPSFETPDGGSAGNADCDNVLEVVYRDFHEDHPDFEETFTGDNPRMNLVEADLGPDNKPVFKDSWGCFEDREKPGVCDIYYVPQKDDAHKIITSAETFSDWYNTKEGTNIEFPRTLTLTEEAGNYVYDSAAFFPLGPDEGFKVPAPAQHLGQNFLFTTEIHVRFTYRSGQKFTFRGDDDLWIFVNRKLALDLGSLHLPAEGTIDFDAQAQKLGITPGNSYPMDIFHAERHTSQSNFRFQTNISCFVPGMIE